MFCTYNCSECEMYVVLCSVVECVVWNGVSPEGCSTGVEEEELIERPTSLREKTEKMK